jgi:hypothetical protein
MSGVTHSTNYRGKATNRSVVIGEFDPKNTSRFQAKYVSKCRTCEGTIPKGDWMRVVKGKPMCVGCDYLLHHPEEANQLKNPV